MNTGEVIALIKAFGGGGGSFGGGVLVVHDVNGTLDKTWNEIKAAALNQGVAVQVSENHISSYVELSGSSDAYSVYAIDEYYTDSADGYPAKQ
jgi:pyrroline-5-carboxylate reductase